ncbi:MAG: cobyric acid synthase [Candidatus Methanoplasma sp.]|nr:cobyric acid synthase [Candidatus Methanoplasma sp.]
MSILFIGTASGAGKTTVTAMYCRHLRRKGVRVAPYKAVNLSLNSYVTQEGKEIGMGQAFQAWASGLKPSGDMNPVLLKPSGNGRIQTVLCGTPAGDVTEKKSMDAPLASAVAYEAYDRLRSKYDVVVCEGSGSPVELNLMDRDIANIGLMRNRRVPAILVGDIERGGVFAALYGTWLLLPDDVRPLVKGFLINRFRGDASLLDGGVRTIEDITGMKHLGTIPYRSLKFPEEDSLSDSDGRLSGDNAEEAFMSNIDALLDAALEAGVDFQAIERLH